MFKYLKKSYILGVVSYFAGSVENNTTSVESNETKKEEVGERGKLSGILLPKQATQLLKNIEKDGINGEDADKLKKLNELLDAKNEAIENISQLKNIVKEAFEQTLENGYSGKTEKDYNSLINMMKVVSPDFKMPEYKKFKDAFGEKFSVVFDGEKIHVYDSDGDVTNFIDKDGKITDSGIRDVFDDNDYSNDNKIDFGKEIDKNYEDEMLKKASDFIKIGNKSLKEQGLNYELILKNGKEGNIDTKQVTLVDGEGNRVRYFTVPYIVDGKKMHSGENENRLNDVKIGMNNFLKRYIPEFGTIYEKNQKRDGGEKIAALKKDVESYNERLMDFLNFNIDNVKDILPDGVSVSFDSTKNHVEIKNKDGYVIGFYTLPLKNTTGEFINNDKVNKERKNFPEFKAWVEKVLKEKNLVS